MKNSHTCTKCSSKSVVRIPGSVGGWIGGNNIVVGLTKLSAIKVTRFLCAECGFFEEWIENPRDLAQLEYMYT